MRGATRMTINNNDVIRCAVVWKCFTNDIVNVHYLRCTGIVAQTPDQIEQDIVEYFTGAYAFVAAYLSNTNVHQRIDVFNITGANPETTLGRVAALDGTNGGEILPTQCAAMIFYRTGVSRHIGKTFLPPSTEGVITAANWVPAFKDAMVLFGAYVDGAVTMTNGVILRKLIWDKSAGIGRNITSVAVPDQARTQRRRRTGVGS